MNGSLSGRVICKYNLRGMCRFGKRCRNIHEDPEKFVQKIGEKLLANKPPESSDPQLEGACALSPSKPRAWGNSTSQTNTYRQDTPGTSSSNEYLSDVQTKQYEEKTCGICFDVITKKVNRFEQTFGILPNCNHCFCFTCIRRWRQSKEFETEVSKSCPECRVASDFVYPAKFWIENKEAKDSFISNQKQRMKKLDCKYFRKGRGKCPFGNTCFYLHALPNGKELDVGPPKPRRRRPGNSVHNSQHGPWSQDLIQEHKLTSSNIAGGNTIIQLVSARKNWLHLGASSKDTNLLDNCKTDEELVHHILFWLNDSDLDIDTTDSDADSDFDLDLDDPCIAYQYYDRDDIRRYIALDSLMNLDSDTRDDSEMNFFFV